MIEKINSASFLLTENCNMACKYCFELGKQSPKLMTREVAEKAIDFLIRGAKENNNKEIHVTFFGGEPLLNLDVMRHAFDYGVLKCKENGLKFSCDIITNGTIYNKEYEDFLLHWYNTLGEIRVQLSVDGVPEVQDTNRIMKNGQGSSKIIEENIIKYMKFKKQNNLSERSIYVHGCLSKASLPRMYESYIYFRNLGFDGCWFMPIHEESWDDNDAEIFRTELTKIADYIYNECKTTNSIKPFKAYSSLSNCRTKFPSAPCGAGKTYATVTPEGDLYPCHSFYFNDKTLKFGNVFTGEDINKRKVFLDYASENLFGDQPCHDCGNASCYRCIAANYIHNGNFLVGFPGYCKLSRIENEIRKDLVAKLANLGLMKNIYQEQQSQECQKQSNLKELADDKLKKIIASMEDSLYGLRQKYEQDSNEIKVIHQKVDFILNVLGELTKAMIEMGEKNA